MVIDCLIRVSRTDDRKIRSIFEVIGLDDNRITRLAPHLSLQLGTR